MKSNKILFVAVVLILGTSLSGCIGVNHGFRGIRTAIINDLGGDFDKEIEFSVGPAGILFVSAIAGMADLEEDVDIAAMLRQISRVQIGVYKRERGNDTKPSINLLRKISDKMLRNGWQYIVRSVKDDEMACVFVQTKNGDHLNEVFIIALSDEDLVITEVLGNLDALIEIAIRNQGHNLNFANR
ncbi:MAG: DUF4252 domain-containing protein [bacterium]